MPAAKPEPTPREAPLTDAEEAAIQRQIAANPDDFELPEGAELVPFAEALPELAESIRRGRGRPPTGRARIPVTLRLDPDVLERFRATGPGWQTRINEALRAAGLPAAPRKPAP